MTIIAQQNFEAGTVGSSIATGSSGGGQTGIAVTGTAPIITGTAGEVITGTKSAKSQAAAGAASAMNMPVTLGTVMGLQFDYTIDAAQWASTADEILHTARGSSATRLTLTLRGSDKKLTVGVASGTYVTPSAMPGAGTYTFNLAIDTGTTATAPYDGRYMFGVLLKSSGAYVAGMTTFVSQTAQNIGAGISWSNVNVGAISTTGTPARSPIWDNVLVSDQYAFIAAAANVAPTVTAGTTVVMTTGSTATVVFTANDSDGTISSWETPTVTSTADTAPTVGTPTLAGMGTANATATYPVSNLTNSDTTVSTRPVDNSGAPAATYANARIVYTSTAPKAKAVTLVGCTMTSPATGTPKAAWNAWVADQALTTPTGVAPPEFTTAAPPASNATVTVDYQPLDVANVAPTFSHSWCLNPDTTTPATVYVDLKFSGTTVATASQVLSTTTPSPVGRTLTSGETALIGSGTLARVAPTVVSRFS